jgi:hypothetical protein
MKILFKSSATHVITHLDIKNIFDNELENTIKPIKESSKEDDENASEESD